MRQAVILRSAAGRASSHPASTRTTESVRAVPDAAVARRSVLLGLATSVASLASSASRARAAGPLLSDLVRPLVQKMDENGDGLLDVDEIRGALQRNGGLTLPRETVVRDVMAPVDFNDDAVLTVDEFSRGMALELEVDERWLRVMERDGEAGVSLEELQLGLGDLGERGREVVPVAFKMADKDKNGRLDREEAQNAMNLIAAGVTGDFGAEGAEDDE
ncbi:hypothetical protein VOLCADRAFT_104520 [Volvox carteri f. nagariensis]|uniref:EF-hand domain-containing protein n=1 Tax=Volvox carteri f. nagariensis TaxID=3068 RepID=D8TU62_VOLCA|nr:uncharacterized protein VOLCADRAFT_104520 [Volvox carteri f. nagariensis]EFJ49088.1 hypothetical protein VOLCADRAFT_104520 [Volvox carteri f. nagariensis]|eukprot:XP_002949985.1 hypothetical protein VOLCADRAFT_104520 [Volvox carteri f. nagariensis]